MKRCSAVCKLKDPRGFCDRFEDPSLNCRRWVDPDQVTGYPTEFWGAETHEQLLGVAGTSDDPKPPVGDMLEDFALALKEVARVTGFGCSKHGELGSWRTYPDDRKMLNAKARHAMEALVQERDDESGLYCLAHEAWNCLALLQRKLEAKAKNR